MSITIQGYPLRGMRCPLCSLPLTLTEEDNSACGDNECCGEIVYYPLITCIANDIGKECDYREKLYGLETWQYEKDALND